MYGKYNSNDGAEAPHLEPRHLHLRVAELLLCLLHLVLQRLVVQLQLCHFAVYTVIQLFWQRVLWKRTEGECCLVLSMFTVHELVRIYHPGWRKTQCVRSRTNADNASTTNLQSGADFHRRDLRTCWASASGRPGSPRSCWFSRTPKRRFLQWFLPFSVVFFPFPEKITKWDLLAQIQSLHLWTKHLQPFASLLQQEHLSVWTRAPDIWTQLLAMHTGPQRDFRPKERRRFSEADICSPWNSMFGQRNHAAPSPAPGQTGLAVRFYLHLVPLRDCSPCVWPFQVRPEIRSHLPDHFIGVPDHDQTPVLAIILPNWNGQISVPPHLGCLTIS